MIENIRHEGVLEQVSISVHNCLLMVDLSATSNSSKFYLFLSF